MLWLGQYHVCIFSPRRNSCFYNIILLIYHYADPNTNGDWILQGYLVIILICSVYNIFCFSSAALWCVVQRTKLCLDFTCTVHFYHFIVCWIYNGTFPLTASWWLTNVLSIVFMTVLGEYLCMRTEMQAIPLSMGQKVDL